MSVYPCFNSHNKKKGSGVKGGRVPVAKGVGDSGVGY